MIDEIDVRNLALIREAAIAPSPRMTVITGETGAGKTALLAACRLLMGQRADKDMVREGAAMAEVEGRLYLAEGADVVEGAEGVFAGDEEGERGAGVDAGVDEGGAAGSGSADVVDGAFAGDGVVVARTLSSDGRSRVKINGRMASVGELADFVGPSISLCSQHDQVALIRPAMHRIFLDRWAQVPESEEFASYREAFAHERECRARLERLERDAQASDAKLEEARFKMRQIGAVDPSVDDYEELMCALRRAENAELLARTSTQAHAALSGDGGALDSMNSAISLLEDGAVADSELGQIASALRDALYAIEDAARDAGRYADALDFDAAGVESMQERAAAYQSLMRAFGPTVADVVAAYEAACAIVAAHDGADGALSQAKAELAQAEVALSAAASQLHGLRVQVAPRFAAEMNAILAQLGMGASSLSCCVDMSDRASWSQDGPDAVRFMFTPSAGMQPRPLSKIASGGELGRVMLALHVAMGERDGISTLVFDEVDAGVGGNVASAVGDVMARLSQTHQVIVVTHSAQLASRADKHFIASKSEGASGMETCIREVAGEARVAEVARMLSGSLTDASMVHARELLSCKTAVNAG